MKRRLTKNGRKVSLVELIKTADQGSVRTFHKKIYQIQGGMAQDIVTGKKVNISKIYYEIRTVKNKKGKVIAKRKNSCDELMRIN